MKNILHKVKRRVLRQLYNLIPYNSSFKAVGMLVPSPKNDNPNIQFHPIYAAYHTELKIPKEYYDAMLKKDYDIVVDKNNPLLKSSKTDAFVLEIPNGRVYTDNIQQISIITKDNRLIDRVSYQYRGGKTVDTADSTMFKQKFFLKPKKYAGTVFVMLSGGGASEGNYYHWMIDTLPRLHLLQKSGLFPKIDWFLVPQYQYAFQKETLRLLGIDAQKVIAANENFHLTCDNLVTSTHPRGEKSFLVPEWIFDFYKNTFSTTAATQNSLDSPYIYISRSDSKKRKIKNESEVIKLVNEYGFKEYSLSSLSFLEQIALFSSAKIILSAHGAGLTNLLFCKEGTKLIEFYSEGFVHSYFYNLAVKMNIDYHFLIFKHPNPAYQEKKGQLEDIEVDFPKLKERLDKLIKN